MTASRPAFAPEAIKVAAGLLGDKFGPRASTIADVRRQHAHTLTYLAPQLPDIVVWPETTGEVAQIVRIAAEHHVPVIAFGAGTSLEGHVNAPHGGICIDLSRMAAVIEVNARDLDCRIEAGVTRKALNEHLRHEGLFFPVDPGAEEATLGGMAATRASGTTTMRYGSMRDNVLGLTAVMADGKTIRTGSRARKSSAGYDLTRLLIGSEGTLGIITELTLRLFGVPDTLLAAVCQFPTVEAACNTAIDAVAMGGLGLARIELLDSVQMAAVNAHAKLALAERPTLFLEFHGAPAAVREQLAVFEDVAKGHGAETFDWATDESERRRLWKARHEAYWAIRATAKGREILATDVCVPVSRLAYCVTATIDDAARLGLVAPILGHVGDGNFHATPLFDTNNEREMRALAEFLDRLVARALACGGTCTGEHGIGQGKKSYLALEAGGSFAVMRAVKQALDPAGILNPGKLLD